MIPPRVLAIGGADSSGSAGIQADIKTYTAHGVFGLSVLTVVTAQNTLGVKAALALPLDFITAQWDAVWHDIGADIVKTGLLGRREVVELVAEWVQVGGVPLVVDPVVVNGQGQLIVSPDTILAYRERLIPLAQIVTPNLDEVYHLTGLTVTTIDDARHAAIHLVEMGARAALVKGGHLVGERKVDVLFNGEQIVEFDAPTLPIENPHGVGCTFASAIAAQLALGVGLVSAVQAAHTYLQLALQGAQDWQLGKGRQPVRHWLP